MFAQRFLVLASLALAGCGGGGASSAAGSLSVSPAVVSSPAAAATNQPTAAPAGTTLTSSADWPTFAHDLSRTSTQPASSGITAATVGGMQLLWHFRSAASFDLSSPIESGGIVFAADLGGNLTALNATTGAVVWQRSFGQSIKVTPAVYDGHLFVGTFINAAGKRSEVYSLDPATGATNWEASIPGALHGSPIAVNGQLFVPVSLGDPGYCNPGGVYAFDESTGTTGIHWLTGGTTAANGGAVWSPLTFDGTRILYGTGNTCLTSPLTGNAVVSLSTSLQLLWAYQTANPNTDDDVGGGVIENGNLAYVTGKTGNLYAFRPASGRLAWQTNLGVADLLGSYSTPAIAGGTLVTSVGYRYDPYATEPTGTQYGGLVGLDPASGAERWSVLAVSPFYSPPAVAGGLIFTTVDSTLAALDPATGTTVWSTPIEASSRSAVAVANDEVFASDSDGFLYAFGFPTAANAAARSREASFHITPAKPSFVNHIPVFCKLK